MAAADFVPLGGYTTLHVRGGGTKPLSQRTLAAECESLPMSTTKHLSSWLVRAAVGATVILYFLVFVVIASTPEGDKDSHAFAALSLVVYVSPCVLLLSV